MTAKERAKMARLEAENRELRERLSNHIRVYGQTLGELVEAKARIEAIKMALSEDPAYG